MERARKAGSVIVVRFVLSDPDPDRASQTLQAALEKVLRRSPEIIKTPEILEAHSLQPPDPAEMDPANPVSPLWAEWAMSWGRGKVRGL